MIKSFKLGVFAIFIGPLAVHSQTSLSELIRISTENYPHLQAKRLETQATQKSIAYEKADFTPQISASYQANYSTANNITGMFLPGQVMPISGPPSEENTNDFIYGSAAALLMNWTPFTFGKRNSRVQEARERKELAVTDEQLAIFEHQINFVNTYLDYWQAAAVLKAKEKDLERYAFNLELSKVMVENGLRPGVDSAQYRTLWSKAKISLLDARKTKEAQKAKVNELLGIDEWNMDMDTDPGLQTTIPSKPDKERFSHPLLERSRQHTHLFLAEKSRISRTVLPDFVVWGTTFARGSAINFDGSFERPEAGLSFSRYNYGLGFQISMPLLQFAKTRHLTQRQDFRIAAAEAYERQVERVLDREEIVATTTLENALEAAAFGPQYVESATHAYEAMRARYDAGLINLSEMLQAQFDLAAAETEDIKIRAEMWKALLYYAAVKGDLELFIQNLN